MNENRKLEYGCLMVVLTIVLGAAALYIDYYYRLTIVKEAIRQVELESKE